MAVILFSVSLLDPQMWGVLVIPWQALSFTLSMMPFIVLFAYLLDCRKKRARPSFREYWQLLGVVKKAKRESYEQTAESLLLGDAPRIVVAILAWLLIVATWLAGNWSLIKKLLS